MISFIRSPVTATGGTATDTTSGDVMLDPALVAVLVCPVDHAALRDEEETLVCSACGRRYPVVDELPDLIPEDAQPAS